MIWSLFIRRPPVTIANYGSVPPRPFKLCNLIPVTICPLTLLLYNCDRRVIFHDVFIYLGKHGRVQHVFSEHAQWFNHCAGELRIVLLLPSVSLPSSNK